MAAQTRLPNEQVRQEAMLMAMGFRPIQIEVTDRPYATDVMNHLRVIAEVPAELLHPRVLDAAQRGSDDPEQLVRNLLALMAGNSPVRPDTELLRASQRNNAPRTSPSTQAQTANRPDAPRTSPSGTSAAGRPHAAVGNRHRVQSDNRAAAPGNTTRTAAAPRHAGTVGSSATQLPGMPSAETLRGVLDALNGTVPSPFPIDISRELFDTRIATRVAGQVSQILTSPASQLDPRVLDAAQRAGNDGPQLVRNLLGLAAGNRAGQPQGIQNESRMPSQDVLTDAVGMLNGMHDLDLTGVTGLNTHHVVNHLADIGARPEQLAEPVRRAARDANNNPEQLVHNLLALVTANPQVLSSRSSPSSQLSRQTDEAGTSNAPH
jgi:hypothetical protein